MERIFKIKTKTNKNPRMQYPSERRYSASTVIGLSIVFMQLFLYSILMGTLIIHKISLQSRNETTYITDVGQKNEFVAEENVQQLYENLEHNINQKYSQYNLNIPALVCAGCFIMGLGYLFAFGTGLFAWRKWYIDHYITFFFLASTLSTVTSSLSFLLSLLPIVSTDFGYEVYMYEEKPKVLPITFSLALNIIILSCLGIIWSFMSTRIAYKGMKTNYPGDIAYPKNGSHVEINRVMKGNKGESIFPPDIISHFPVSDKLAKYLPKKENNNFPKAESNTEFQQRVNKFLSEQPGGTEN